MWAPAVLHGIALAMALCVQSLSSPLASSWFIFFIVGCAFLLKDGYPKKDLTWYACCAWLFCLLGSCFLIKPIPNGAETMWLMSAMPILALCLHEKHLKPYLIIIGSIVSIYATGLIIQQILGIHYTNFNIEGMGGRSWPLIDPNNAAVIVNAGLITSFFFARRHKRFFALFTMFLAALLITKSKAGMIAGLAACSVLAMHNYGFIIFVAEGIAAIIIVWFFDLSTFFAAIGTAIAERLPIWHDSMPLLWISPLSGLGLGSYGYYYQQVRSEHYTGGWFAHNDILQFAIEMGIPMAATFLGLIGCVIVTSNKKNIIPVCFILSVFFQSMVEFQFYLPSISILLGVALAYHRCNNLNYGIQSHKR